MIDEFAKKIDAKPHLSLLKSQVAYRFSLFKPKERADFAR
jgi:hypothetical protein